MPLTDADIAKFDAGRPLSDADIAAHDSAQHTAGTGRTGNRLKGNTDPVEAHPWLTAATAAQIGGPILGEAAGILPLGAAARLASAGRAGLAEGLSDLNISHPFSPKPFAAALKAAIDDFRGNTPPQTPAYPDLSARKPGWAGIPQESPAALPDVQPVRTTVTPSGRSPIRPNQPVAGPGIASGRKFAGTPPPVVPISTAAPAAAEDPELLDAIAQSQAGKPFRKLGTSQQNTVRDLARRFNSAVAPAAAPAPVTPIAPRPQPAASAVPSGPIDTIFDIVRREGAAQQPAVQPTAPPAEPTLTMKQAEAAMARKTPATPESPQSQFTAAGERKSPQLRAAEITNANRQAKAQRMAQALLARGVEPGDLGEIPMGHFAQSQLDAGVTPGWGNIAHELGEKEPSGETIGMIYDEMMKLKRAASPLAKNPKAMQIAEQLRREMESSGTIGAP